MQKIFPLPLFLILLLSFCGKTSFVMAEAKNTPTISSGSHAKQTEEGSGSPENGDTREDNESVSRELLEKLGRLDDFSEALEKVMPLEPAEIRRARDRREALEEAKAPVPALMRTESRRITLDPKGIPHVITLTDGYTSTLVFQDRTGEPWPISHVILGNANAFSLVQPDKEEKGDNEGERRRRVRESSSDKMKQNEERTSEEVPRKERQGEGMHANAFIQRERNTNILNILPLRERANSNLAVTLEGVGYPIVFQLLTDSPFNGRRTSDALVVFRIDRMGPNAKHILLSSPYDDYPLPEESLLFLHGMIPEKAERLTFHPPIRAMNLWEYRENYYVKTSHSLIWPAWQRIAYGQDTTLYVLPKTHSLVLAVDGKTQTIQIDAKE